MISKHDKQGSHIRVSSLLIQLAIFILFLSIPTLLVFGAETDGTSYNQLDQANAEHAHQQEFYELILSGQHHQAFELAFELGDELFETTFNTLDGVGANVGEHQRFTRIPRADLSNYGEWADHVPKRETGPNAQSCNACHNLPFDDGAGQINSNVHRDPLHSGTMATMIQRNTPHLFGAGAIQRLAEEMTERLHAIRDRTIQQACRTQKTQIRTLKAKGVEFGSLTIRPTHAIPCRYEVHTEQIKGVDEDLVLKPFQWKGHNTTLRDFNRGASHNELGMQAVELVGRDEDGDFDGITNEMTIGDQTALAIYLAAQPRPTTKIELARLGILEPLSDFDRQSIRRGKRIFHQVGCTSCHTPSLRIKDPIFREPSVNAHYRDEIFPSGLHPIDELVDPTLPVSFDLTRDQPDNIVQDKAGREFRLGSFQRDHRGRAIIRLYSDLRRHDLGSDVAEPIDEIGTGHSIWLTKELWGVGSTGPYLHDGRASTLTEAILAHGGEGQNSRQRFQELPLLRQQHLLDFLENLILFKIEKEE